ncbi:hypothetical protein LB530_01420 [Mesorhizobium sp. CO1-1-3]|uniref:hypothetical protein n=1 Tax=Mesorhizobium sp. CO1-1-3 TaxID=2876634 RepID=UPI001CCCC5DA|nr:hypothetical protein [Mesorhizobium sp. CO1-1-3]MBZ9699556.1 hypothetical protein [Mesorhizobium sp. CO1-1-3]
MASTFVPEDALERIGAVQIAPDPKLPHSVLDIWPAQAMAEFISVQSERRDLF